MKSSNNTLSTGKSVVLGKLLAEGVILLELLFRTARLLSTTS